MTILIILVTSAHLLSYKMMSQIFALYNMDCLGIIITYIFTSIIIIIIQYKTREITGGPKNLLTFCISSAAWRKAPT